MSIVCTQLNSFKYCYLTVIILYAHSYTVSSISIVAQLTLTYAFLYFQDKIGSSTPSSPEQYGQDNHIGDKAWQLIDYIGPFWWSV